MLGHKTGKVGVQQRSKGGKMKKKDDMWEESSGPDVERQQEDGGKI